MKDETFWEVVSNTYDRLFAGRVRRRVFWKYVLFYYLIVLGCMGVAFLMKSLGLQIVGTIFTFVGYMFGFICAIPNLSVQVRRLHDTGRSGWYIFLPIVPYAVLAFLSFATPQKQFFSIAAALSLLICYLVLYCKDSEPGENKYGPNPKVPSETNPTLNTL